MLKNVKKRPKPPHQEPDKNGDTEKKAVGNVVLPIVGLTLTEVIEQ